MPKFYLQSGTVSFVVCAVDVEGAALWAMHRTMDKMVEAYEAAKAEWLDPDYEDEVGELLQAENNAELGVPEGIPYDAMLEGLSQFDETIVISELGYGRDEAGQLATEDIFRKWRQLMLAVDRLHRKDPKES
jgi:hypothetical protein